MAAAKTILTAQISTNEELKKFWSSLGGGL